MNRTKGKLFHKFDELKAASESQIAEFNEHWDSVIEALSEESHRIESALLEQHEAERDRFEEEMERQSMPVPKHSSQLINKRFRLEQLLRNKRYSEAKLLKERLERLEREEQSQWLNKWLGQRDRNRELLSKKQKNEFDTLKARLEKSINSKLISRMTQYDKLLQKVQNLQNELITRQSLHFMRFSTANAKLLAKHNDKPETLFGALQEHCLKDTRDHSFQRRNVVRTVSNVTRSQTPVRLRERRGGPVKREQEQSHQKEPLVQLPSQNASESSESVDESFEFEVDELDECKVPRLKFMLDSLTATRQLGS